MGDQTASLTSRLGKNPTGTIIVAGMEPSGGTECVCNHTKEQHLSKGDHRCLVEGCSCAEFFEKRMKVR